MEGSLSACWLAMGPRSAGGSTMVDTKSNAFLGKLNFSHCSLEQSRNYVGGTLTDVSRVID